jgi:hypothetical protein
MNQPIKMLVKRPTKAPATIHRVNSPTDRNLLLEDTGTAYHDVRQIADPDENRFRVDRRQPGHYTRFGVTSGWAVTQTFTG